MDRFFGMHCTCQLQDLTQNHSCFSTELHHALHSGVWCGSREDEILWLFHLGVGNAFSSCSASVLPVEWRKDIQPIKVASAHHCLLAVGLSCIHTTSMCLWLNLVHIRLTSSAALTTVWLQPGTSYHQIRKTSLERNICRKVSGSHLGNTHTHIQVQTCMVYFSLFHQRAFKDSVVSKLLQHWDQQYCLHTVCLHLRHFGLALLILFNSR